MNTKSTTCILLLLLLAAAGVRTQGTQHTYIQQVADSIWVDAGIETQILVILRNTIRPSVSLTMQVQGDSNFKVDTLYQHVDIDSGRNAIQYVRFLSDTGGTFSTLLMVTDGTVTDSVLLTAVVNPNPFVLLPPIHSIWADLGVPIQFKVTIQNLTAAQLTLNLSISGDPGFTMSVSSPIVLPAYGSYIVPLQFLGTSAGTSRATLSVGDGSYSSTSKLAILTIDSPYKWITEVFNPIITKAETMTHSILSLRNTSGTPVTLHVSLNGDPAFQLDSTMEYITVDNYGSLLIPFFSPIVGLHTTLLTITDGIDVDTVTLTIQVIPGSGKFTVTPYSARMDLTAQVPDTLSFAVQNRTDNPLTVVATLSGDAHFYLGLSQPLVIPARSIESFSVYFSGAPVGIYRSMLAVTSGSEIDSILIWATVSAPYGGNELFITDPIWNRTITFAAPPGGTDIENVSIRNLSDSTILVTLGILNDSSFAPSMTSVAIDSGQMATVAVTFTNPPLGRAYGHLTVECGNERSVINLLGETNTWSDYAGLRVMNYLDFGGVDTSSQYCRDLWLINTTANTIGISNVQLTGFAPDFTVTSATSFSLAAFDSTAIRICYTPTSLVYQDNDILTFIFDNPAATPNQGHIAVNITGWSRTVSPEIFDSTRMVIFEVHTMIAPIGGFSEKTIELHNLAPYPILLDNLQPMQGDLISLLTPLPITLPAYNPTYPGSGRTTIRVRYAPTWERSTPNKDDRQFLAFGSNTDSLRLVIYSISIYGKPLVPIPGSNPIALYPENGLAPIVTLGEPTLHSTSVLHFRNNLSVPVTITSCNLESGSYAEIADTDALPATIQPGADMSVTLRVTKDVQELTPDAIIMRGSHEHLNSRYEIYNGKMTTGIEQPPVRISGFAVHAAPNPSDGNVAIYLNETLRNGRIRILDVLGRTVAELESVAKTVNWNATVNGTRIPAGSYFIHVSGIDIYGNHVTALHNIVLLP